MKSPIAMLLLVGLACVPPQAPAQQHVTIYRCTDATGALLIQNDQPCPEGHRQQTQVIDVPPPLPAHVPREVVMPEVAAAEAAAAEAVVFAALPATVAVEARTAPPALFECTTWENNKFLTEEETPAERCAPIRVVGLDGRNQPRRAAHRVRPARRHAGQQHLRRRLTCRAGAFWPVNPPGCRLPPCAGSPSSCR